MSSEQVVWPAIQYEELPWRSQLDPDLIPRARRERLRHPYGAAVVPSIAELPVLVPSSLITDADEATQLLTRFDAEVGPTGLPFASILLRSESASSSEIERLTSGARAVAEAELGERRTGNAAQIVRNVSAMKAAIALADDIDAHTIIAMQEALLGEIDPRLTGDWREEQVWIGGDSLSPHDAAFVPPHHRRVPDAIQDLIRFIHRDDVPALIQVAIAHAQFETIHPFPDGNGRTGRALVQAMLRHLRVTTNVTVPVSAGLLNEVDRYYAALDAYRLGDIAPIVESFANAARYAVVNGRALRTDLDEIESRWSAQLAGIRADAAARRVATLAISHPALNSEVVVRELSIAAPTAFRALDTLVERGVLRQANSQQRNRIWLAEPVLRALDSFAARAGRRAAPTAP